MPKSAPTAPAARAVLRGV